MRWIFPLLLAMWVVSDAARRGRRLCYDYGTFVFFSWPLLLPVYLVQSRRGGALFNFLTIGAMALLACAEYWLFLQLMR